MAISRGGGTCREIFRLGRGSCPLAIPGFVAGEKKSDIPNLEINLFLGLAVKPGKGGRGGNYAIWQRYQVAHKKSPVFEHL